MRSDQDHSFNHGGGGRALGVVGVLLVVYSGWFGVLVHRAQGHAHTECGWRSWNGIRRDLHLDTVI